jgi:hypothetical protein
VGEELSQSLARPESIGVLACEAMHSETFIPKRKFSLPQYWRGYATYLAHLHCQHLTSSFRLETILLVILSAAKNLKCSPSHHSTCPTLKFCHSERSEESAVLQPQMFCHSSASLAGICFSPLHLFVIPSEAEGPAFRSISDTPCPSTSKMEVSF